MYQRGCRLVFDTATRSRGVSRSHQAVVGIGHRLISGLATHVLFVLLSMNVKIVLLSLHMH